MGSALRKAGFDCLGRWCFETGESIGEGEADEAEDGGRIRAEGAGGFSAILHPSIHPFIHYRGRETSFIRFGIGEGARV